MKPSDTSVRSHFSRPAYACTGETHGLRPLLGNGATLAQWQTQQRPALQAQWQAFLGEPAFAAQLDGAKAECVQSFEAEGFRADVYKQPTGFGQEQTLIVLHPRKPARRGASASVNEKLPAAVVPFYYAERSSGFVNGSAARGSSLSVDAELREVVPLGLHLVRLGLTVVCVEAFPFNTVPEPANANDPNQPFGWWHAAATKLLADHPQWTGMGRLVHDTRRALDLLFTLPNIDPSRVLMMGHSLGGKMSLFTSALDERVTAVIGSDFGLPWRSTNWNDIWYLADRVPPTDDGQALHELLALLAPRPFLLIAGETDSRTSWQYLQAARAVYDLYDAGTSIGCIDHSSGHAPAIAALEVAYAWLAEVFELPHRNWRV